MQLQMQPNYFSKAWCEDDGERERERVSQEAGHLDKKQLLALTAFSMHDLHA